MTVVNRVLPGHYNVFVLPWEERCAFRQWRALSAVREPHVTRPT